MPGAGHLSERMRGWGLSLTVLALLVRLLFPAGYMLSQDRTALPTLVICTGQGSMTVEVDAQGHAHRLGEKHDDKSTGDKSSHPCTFAAATGAVVAPVLIAALAPIPPVQVIASALQVTQRPGLALAAPPPPTTGPPARI